MTHYRLSVEAELDLIRIHQYGVRQFGHEQAERYFYRFYRKFDQIAKTPHLYPSAGYIREGYRRCICGVDTIYYRISNNNIVEIMAIVGRQDAKHWLR